jgi:oligopeptide transport system substrate-binding protein
LQNRRNQVVALSVAGMLAVAGCGGGGKDDKAASSGGSGGSNQSSMPTVADDPNAPQAGEISVRGCKPQNPLIPTSTNETCGGNLLDAILGKLVKYNSDDGHAENDIADSITTKDAKTFTIKIKKDVKFTDGTKVTANSFVDAWNWGAYEPHAQLNAYFFEPIKGYKDLQGKNPKSKTMSGLKVVNPTTFTVTMSEVTSTFPQRLGYTAFAPLPDSFFKDDGKSFGKKPIGAGPFKITQADPNKQFTLEAVPDYHRIGRPHIAKVIYKVYSQINAAYNDLLGNQLDMIDEIPTDHLVGGQYLDELKGRDLNRVVGVFQAVNFPPSKTDPSYDNPDLRHAISMAIDRDTIIKNVFNNTREPATGWVSPVVDGYEPGACGDFCKYDPKAAKELYDKAGGHQGPITIGYNADADHEAWVKAACVSISDALKVECLPKPTVNFATFRQDITERKETGMFRAGWQMDYPSIENFLVPLYETGASSNDGDYSNPAFDAKCKEASAQTDIAQVNATYAQAEKLLAADMPSIPLWYSKVLGGYSTKIATAKFTVFSTYDFSSITLK